MRRAAVLIALALLPARPAFGDVLEGWPCSGCITVTPPSAASDAGPPAPPTAEDGGVPPRPLLVALHGDGGAVRPLVRAFQAAAASAGVVLLAPSCPRSLGCTGSWWQWLDGAGHDPRWLGAQIDAVTARFAIDPRRIFATGYSGGATYLGWYAPTHGDRFAALAHVAGGAPYRPSCPACKVPVLFLLGATDPMIGPYTRPLRDWYAACGGHEIVWETLPGVTHDSILDVLQAGRARRILDWLLAHPASCADAPPRLPGPDAATAEPTPPRVDDTPPPATPPAARPPPVPPAAAGCACDVAAPSPRRFTSLTALLAWLATSRRRRSMGSLGDRPAR